MLISALSLQASDLWSLVTKFALWVHLTGMQQLPGFDLHFRVTGVKMDKKHLGKPGWHKA